MKPQQLIAAFNDLAEAPDGVARLRVLILQLAVRGRLVPQNPRDESGAALLVGIPAEMRQLAAAGLVRKVELYPAVEASQLGYGLPTGWSAAPLGNVALVLDHLREPVKADEREARCAGKQAAALYPYFGATQQQGWIDDYRLNGEFVLLGEDGVPFLDPLRHKAYLVSGRIWVNNHAHVLLGVSFSNAFLLHYLNQFDYTGRVTGTTRAKLTKGDLVDIPIPVPPLAEQHRIVERVEELMGLLARLEAARVKRETTRAAARDSVLAALREADSPAEVDAAWARFAQRMDDLACDPADIAPLRQTVLQLAVRGRLVRQEPRDVLATDLLGRVAKAGSVAHPGPSTGSHAPFAVPSTWAWSTLDGVSDPERRVSYGVLVPGADVVGGTPLVRVAELAPRNPPLLLGKRIAPELAQQYERVRLRGDELLVAVVGSIGKVGIARPEWEGSVVARAVARFGVAESVSRDFILIVLLSPAAQEYFADATRTLAQPTLNVGQLKNLPVPVPPLTEQRRIVARVEELMSLLDRLEQRFDATKATHAAFASAAVHHVVA